MKKLQTILCLFIFLLLTGTAFGQAKIDRGSSGSMTYPGAGIPYTSDGVSWGTSFGVGTMTDGYICKYATAGKTISCNTNPTTFQVSLGLVAGTLTDGKTCTYTASGTVLNCNTTPLTYPASGPALSNGSAWVTTVGNTASKPGTCNAGDIYYDSQAKIDYICTAANTWTVRIAVCTNGYCGIGVTNNSASFLTVTGNWFTSIANNPFFTVGASQYNLFYGSAPLIGGTLTDTYWCRYTAAGTLLNCDVNPALYAPLASPTFTGSVGMPANQGYSTTGIMSGAVGFLTKSTAYTVGTGTAQEAYGYFFTATAAMTFTVPTAVTGMNVCFQMIGAHLMTITPTTNDYITLDGTILTQNFSIKGNGTAGDSICLIATSANHWTTWGNKGPFISNGS